MVRFSYIIYLEPYKKSKFYKTLDRYLLSSLAHYGLHEGTMFPPHCGLTSFIDKGDYLPATDIAKFLDRVIEAYEPFPRPVVGKMWPVNQFDVRSGSLRIPINVKPKGVGGLVSKPFEYAMKEFRYDGGKKCNLEILPGKMDHIPLAYNYDQWLTKSAKLSPKQLQGLWDLAQEMIDFKDANTCAWHNIAHGAQKHLPQQSPPFCGAHQKLGDCPRDPPCAKVGRGLAVTCICNLHISQRLQIPRLSMDSAR